MSTENKNLVYTDSELRTIILENLIKMLIERNMLNKENHKTNLTNLLNNFNEYNETHIKDNKNNDIHVKFINYKLTTIRKITDIENFLENKKAHKFIIVSNIQNKAIKQLLEYENTEVFNDYDLKINLIDHILVPKHYILTEEQANEFLDSYKFKSKDLKRMLTTDPVSRYYNLKKGTIVRIERPSINSGIAIDYRIVV